MKPLSLFALFVLLLVSCKDDVDTPADAAPPQVAITAPAPDRSVSVGTPVPVSATASDETKLQRVHIEILSVTTGTMLKHDHFTPANKTYTLNTGFTPTGAGTYRIKFAADDAANNTAEAVVSVTVN